MSWEYTLRDETRVPPCPVCRSVLGVVRLKGDVWVCTDCVPRIAFGARWVEDREEQAS